MIISRVNTIRKSGSTAIIDGNDTIYIYIYIHKEVDLVGNGRVYVNGPNMGYSIINAHRRRLMG